MGIRQITPDSEIDCQLDEAIVAAKRNWVRRLSIIGEKAVNAMRTKGSYTDRTGNLRSSTGYVVVMDGQIMDMSDFQPVKPTGKEGSVKGKDFAKQLAKKFPYDIVLIVVAGMNYAYYVQNRHNKDVTASGELMAEELLNKVGVNPKIQHFKQ